jgi:PAS domain S-box-containing protein
MDSSPSLRLLIVEDDIVDRKRLERLLARSSLGACQVKNADRLAGALELLRSHPCDGTPNAIYRVWEPDLILLDLGLPDSQGMESVVRLQACAPQTPIIVLSGLDDVDVATQAVQMGVQDYLIKGQVDANLLMRAIRYALERKRAERQLQAAELRYRTIFENSAVAIMMVDEQRQLVSWNQFTEQLLGMPGDELLGRPIQEFYPEAEWQRIQALSIRRKGMGHHLETKMIRADGAIIDVDISLSVVHDSDGRTTGTIGVVQDITERKRAEEALLVKDRAINSATSGIVFVDLGGRITFANPSSLQMWGHEEETEVLQKPFPSFLCSEQEGLAAYQAAVKAGTWSGVLAARRKDGSEFIVQVSASLVKDKQGQPLCLMAALTDVTESRRMHEVLDRKQRNLEAIFDAAPLGMLLVNQQMRVVRANGTVHQMSGKQYAHMIDRSPCEALGCLRASAGGSGPAAPGPGGPPPQRGAGLPADLGPVGPRASDPGRGSETGQACDACRLWQTIQTALGSGVPVWGVEVRPKLNEDGDQVQRWLSVSAEPVNVDGVKHAVVAVNDVTDRKRAEEELQETMEMKSQFISTVSHELRTPMTAMREAVIIVLDEIAGKLNEDQKHFLDIAKRNIDRLSRLIDDVLDFQKLNAGKMKFRMQANDIAAAVQEAYATMQPHAAKSRVSLAVEVEPHLPAALYDSDRIMQALTNLISNAIKFTPPGGRVLVSAHRREQQLVIQVGDTGYGIPKEDLPKLFTQFFRVHRPGKEIKGTGLGLAIVSKIVAGHGGRIEVESELDKGTTFTVFLPLTRQHPEDETSDEMDRRLENMLTGQ